MNTDLLARLADPEDNFTERKPEGATGSEFRKTIVAFANSVPTGRIAVLFIGIDDDGGCSGVENTDKLQQTIRRICEVECYPPIRFSCEVVVAEKKAIVAVVVPSSINGPHFAGPAFVRRGSESVVASQVVFNDLVARRVDKCPSILDHMDQVWTVTAVGKRIGDTKPVGDPRYRESKECRVVQCTPHYVRLQTIDCQRALAEPLRNVFPSWDEERQRPMMIVREP